MCIGTEYIALTITKVKCYVPTRNQILVKCVVLAMIKTKYYVLNNVYILVLKEATVCVC